MRRPHDYLASLRPRPEPEPLFRFEIAPILLARLRSPEVRLPWGKRQSFFVVLGDSRFILVDVVERQTALAVMQCLERANAFFGGVRREPTMQLGAV